jgi:hypothetical protein
MAALRKELPGGLVMRSLRDASEAGRWSDFNGEVNNASEGATCRLLSTKHPGMGPDDFWMVEDEARGRIAATICRIPWTLRLDGLELRTTMLEMVLSHPDWRGRGLVRSLIDEFNHAALEDGSDLCIIAGIPYYYRQFGYSYSVAMDERLVLDLDAPEVEATLACAAANMPFPELRRATGGDAGRLVGLREAAMSGLGLGSLRDANYWRFLVDDARFDVRLLFSGEATAGYLMMKAAGDRLAVTEDGCDSPGTALRLLCRFKAEGCTELTVADSPVSPLATLARGLGASRRRGGQWLFRVPDLRRLLEKLGPVFEKRLSASAFAGLDAELRINLFREAFALRFEGGRLASAWALGFVDSSMGADGGDLLVPVDAFVRLLLGFNTLEELYDAWPDTSAKPGSEKLFDTLFPALSSFVHLPFHFQG